MDYRYGHHDPSEPRYAGRQVWNRQRTDTELADPGNVTLAGLLACGVCGRRMESAWSNSKPAYRCRHGRASAMAPDPARPKNTYVREDKLLPYLPALHLLLTTPATRVRRRTRAGADVRPAMSPGEVIGYLRENEITLTWGPAAAALQARLRDRRDRHRESKLTEDPGKPRKEGRRRLGTPIAWRGRQPTPQVTIQPARKQENMGKLCVRGPTRNLRT